MDKLADSELRNIAQDEDIQDYDVLSREELIEALTEKYEDMDSGFTQHEEQDDTKNLRYLAGITDYREISDYVDSLPGVEELPESYPETSIYLLTKNNNWGFAFWSISPIDSRKIESGNGSILLAVSIVEKDGHVEQYDIPVSESDSEWNIGLSTKGGTCTVSIVAEYPNGKKEIISTSNPLSQIDCYWLQNTKEMRDNDSLFKVYLSLITTKDGELINNALVGDIVNAYKKEDIDE